MKSRIGYMKESDFDRNHVDASRNGAFIFKGKRITSVLDYHNAQVKDSLAGQYIDAGLTPYLCSWSAYADHVWPWVEIQDIEKESLSDGRLVVYHPNGRHVLLPDTLVFWR